MAKYQRKKGEFVVCDICGASVKTENIAEHKIRVHSKDLFSKGNPIELGLITTDEIEALCNKATDLMNEGKCQESVELFEVVLRVDSSNYRAWNDLGLAFEYLGKNRKALKAFDKSIEIKPDSAVAWSNKACLLFMMKRNDEALQCYEETVKRDEQIIQAWHNMGSILVSKGRFTEAIKYFDKAISLNDEYYMAWMAKAQVLGLMDKRKKSEKCLKRAYELNPEYAWKSLAGMITGERMIHESGMMPKKGKMKTDESEKRG